MNKNNLELIKLIQENPEATLMICVRDDDYSGEFSSEYGPVRYAQVNELTSFDNRLIDKEDLLEELVDALSFHEEYKKISNEEFNKLCLNEVSKYEFKKYIILNM